MAKRSGYYKKQTKKSTEVLAPVGNIQAFYAALESGANAVYCGLKQFNARGRATNFSHKQFLAVIALAHKSNVKVYATLNTVIKNRELPDLLDTLSFLEKSQCDAVIIQDWGVYNLAKRYFPKLTLHASTQMGIHNSQGVNFAKMVGISRAVLARELTLAEIKNHKSEQSQRTRNICTWRIMLLLFGHVSILELFGLAWRKPWRVYATVSPRL